MSKIIPSKWKAITSINNKMKEYSDQTQSNYGRTMPEPRLVAVASALTLPNYGMDAQKQ